MIYVFYKAYKYSVLQAGSKHIDKLDKVGWTWGSRGGDYEKFYLLGYNSAQSGES
jgi:hypothetical protein